MKIRPVAAELLLADGQRERDRQTNMKKLIVTFLNFTNAPKKFLHQNPHSDKIRKAII
jgi:hypothetical protein